MDFLDLEVFIAAAEMGSMSKAAQKAALSQPSVSSRMAKLEMELGAPLFYRRRSGICLTDSGRRFYFYALYAISAVEAGRQAVGESVSPRKEDGLNIGVMGSLVRVLTPGILSGLRNGSFAGEWQIRSGESAELAVLTASGMLDAAFVSEVPFSLPQLEVCPLFEEPVMLVGPARLESPRYRSLASFLRAEPFILLKRGMPLRELIEKELFESLRMRPQVLIEVDTTDMIRVMVAQGVGCSFLPCSSLWLADADASISAIPLDEIRLKQSFQCVFSSDLSEKQRIWCSSLETGIREHVTRLREAYLERQKIQLL